MSFPFLHNAYMIINDDITEFQNYIQNLSIVNGALYNVATGKDPNKKSPWGELFFSVTMVQKKIVAGTIKMEDLNILNLYNKYGGYYYE